MAKFRWTKDAGANWTVVDETMPQVLAVEKEDTVTVEAIGSGVTSLAIFDYYVDSVNGSDSNTGRGVDAAFSSLAKVQSVISSGESIGLARGSVWRDQLDFTSSGSLTGVPQHLAANSVYAYGTGAAPVIKGADIAPNSNFSTVEGYADTYVVAWTNAFNGTNSYITVFESGSRLQRVASLVNCQATPGSFYTAGPASAGSTDNVYVHAVNSSNIITNGLVYEINKRSFCVAGMHYTEGVSCISPAHHDGGIISNNARACSCSEGKVHNFFTTGGLIEDCVSSNLESFNSAGSGSHFVYFRGTALDGTDAIFRRCTINPGVGSAYNELAGSAAFIGHVGNSTTGKTCTIESCIVTSGGISSLGGSNHVDRLDVVDCVALDLRGGVGNIGLSGSVLNCIGNYFGPGNANVLLPRAVSGPLLNGLMNICGNVFVTSATSGGIIFFDAVNDSGSLNIINNTFVGTSNLTEFSAIYVHGSSVKTIASVNSRNIFYGWGTDISVITLDVPALVSDYNAYDTSHQIQQGIFHTDSPDVYYTLSGWVSASGCDTHSVGVAVRDDFDFVNPIAEWNSVESAIVAPTSPAYAIRAGAQFYTP